MAGRAKTVETASNDAQIEGFKKQLEEVFAENADLRESLDAVTAMLAREDVGWFRFAGGELVDGLELYELHRWAREIREAVAGNPHIKQGLKLRTGYVWKRGIRYAGIQGPKQGRGVNVQARIDSPKNQRNFFGHGAREKRESSLYTDGAYFVIGNEKDWTLQPVPVWEIKGHYSNPDDHGEIWAYLRCWDHWDANQGGEVPMRQWYITDSYPNWEDPSKRPTSFNIGGVHEPVDPKTVMFADTVNGMVGWPYGVPDALSALVWVRLYRDFMVNGKIMSDALAQFAFKATSTTKDGANNAALALGGTQAAGQTAVIGAANTLVPMATAGKGYDFSSGDALAAVVAAALEVSVVHLTANPGQAGSYGASATLDLPTQMAVLSRQQWHIDFDKRILRWLGAANPTVTFVSSLSATDMYREIQALLLMWASGLYEPKPIEARLSEIMDILGNTIPTGVIIPNNSDAAYLDTPNRTAIPNPNGADAAAGSNGGGSQSGGNANGTSPGQGQSTGVGKAPKPNDLRSDRVSQSADIASMLERLDRFMNEVEADEERRRAA